MKLHRKVLMFTRWLVALIVIGAVLLDSDTLAILGTMMWVFMPTVCKWEEKLLNRLKK